jgi:hypothetical protein
MKVKLVTATVLAAAALIGAPSSNATPAQDQAFADTMDGVGIYLYPTAYGQARAICADVWNGWNPDYEVSTIWSYNPTWTYSQAQTFVAASILIYCPPADLQRQAV